MDFEPNITGDAQRKFVQVVAKLVQALLKDQRVGHEIGDEVRKQLDAILSRYCDDLGPITPENISALNILNQIMEAGVPLLQKRWLDGTDDVPASLALIEVNHRALCAVFSGEE
jgi:hypothetical protein